MNDRSAIAGADTLVRWTNVQPGDICHDEGLGFFGWAIKVFTLGAYAHSFVVVGIEPNGDLRTVEAGPKGLRQCRRKPWQVYKVHRLWNTPRGQERIIAEAKRHIGRKYGWGECLAIFLNRLGIPVNAPDNPNTMICSNSTARAAMCGDVPVSRYLTRSPDRIWPARLERDINVAEWNYHNA